MNFKQKYSKFIGLYQAYLEYFAVSMPTVKYATNYGNWIQYFFNMPKAGILCWVLLTIANNIKQFLHITQVMPTGRAWFRHSPLNFKV